MPHRSGCVAMMSEGFHIDRASPPPHGPQSQSRPLPPLPPVLSAGTAMPPSQRVAIVGILVAAAAGLLVSGAAVAAVAVALVTLVSLAFLLVRLAAIAALDPEAGSGTAPGQPGRTNVSQPVPFYTVLVPAFREEPVAAQLVAALGALDYPLDRLEVLFLTEASDPATRDAIARCRPPPHMRLVTVPEGQPRTKPRALNHGLSVSTGDLVVVFDAEDVPDTDQLLKAAAVFTSAGERLGCLQAHLNVYNPADRWLTRQFAIEYSALFDGILPALERHGLVLMLGGTSNHFRRQALVAVGGWDPWNVTEDADLGIRLQRSGYEVRMLSSTTLEEAPRSLGVWLGQRTRWLKGWMQTYLVHMRRPLDLARDLGGWRMAGVQALTGGLALSALAHPWFYAVLLADALGGAHLDAVAMEPAARLLWWLSLANLAASLAVAALLGALASSARGRPELAGHALLTPVYWLAISLAAYRALVELMRLPYHWEKTEHIGLSRPAAGWDGGSAAHDGPPRPSSPDAVP